MRLSETRRKPQPSRQVERESGRREQARTRWSSIPFSTLAVTAAAVVAIVSTGSYLLIHAAPGDQPAAAQQQHAAEPNMNCMLIVPANPLSAQGLATPYQLTATEPNAGPCHEANPNQSAFVQGAILDPATGQIAIYDPLVIDRGTQPLAAPVVPQLPANAVVALWFGFNGDTLRLRDTANTDGNAREKIAQAPSLAAAKCVNGLGDSAFGQFADCNAAQFFQEANALIQAGKLTPPALGTASDGMTCPTVRDFAVVDKDQSDNVTTAYLVRNGRVAQATAANMARFPSAKTAVNGSDNALLAVAMDGALGCKPWLAPDLADNGAMVPALPLNELQAAAYQQAPIATVPRLDPMVLVGDAPNLAKQNLYREGVDQAPVASEAQARADQVAYCQSLLQIAPARLLRDKPLEVTQASPMPAVANNLFTFLAQRFDNTFGAMGLHCTELIHKQSPIKLMMRDGIVVNATITLGTGTGGTGTGDTGTQSEGTLGAAGTDAQTSTATATPTDGATTGTANTTGTPGK